MFRIIMKYKGREAFSQGDGTDIREIKCRDASLIPSNPLDATFCGTVYEVSV